MSRGDKKTNIGGYFWRKPTTNS